MMKISSVFLLHTARRAGYPFFSLLLAFSPIAHLTGAAQTANIQTETPAQTGRMALVPQATGPLFRLERIEVAGGAELLTIFCRMDGLRQGNDPAPEVPLISVLRDTLGDSNPENDRLRYLWMLTYTRPTALQRVASAVPFLYNRVGSKRHAATQISPPPLMDLAATGHKLWGGIFWFGLRNISPDSYLIPFKASALTYGTNRRDYRRAHIARALAVLSLYKERAKADSALSDQEMQDIAARLLLTVKPLGGSVDKANLRRVYKKQTSRTRDVLGHNWELLRQRAEAESLYFEPLEMAGGSATHALLWAARPDLARYRGRRFDSRFLNIANPWRDDRLRYWQGLTQIRYFDAENRAVGPGTPGARAVPMIPLAVYGLDHPKIPILLVDFRDGMNPKRREMSRRVVQDVARNILSLSPFNNIPYFLGRTVYDFVTGRRGADINQPSRVGAYSQLKLLLSLSASLDPQLRDRIGDRLEHVSLNPLENGLRAEAQLARDHYEALVAYARRPGGLPARLALDRRTEMGALAHGRAARALFRLSNLLSLGAYRHREKETADLRARMELRRRLDYDERFLHEVSESGPRIEIVRSIEDVRRSLSFIADRGATASGKTAGAAARIFMRTEDREARELVLKCLYRINNSAARRELLRISRNSRVGESWRNLSAAYLRAGLK